MALDFGFEDVGCLSFQSSSWKQNDCAEEGETAGKLHESSFLDGFCYFNMIL
jgi:hypothetical protein